MVGIGSGATPEIEDEQNVLHELMSWVVSYVRAIVPGPYLCEYAVICFYF